MASKKASGFVTEEQRHTMRLTLRLKPEVMDQLYSLSTELSDEPGSDLSYAEVVTRALAALEREMDAQVAASDQSSTGTEDT